MNRKFKDKRGRTWEIFCDACYFDFYCVRCLNAGKKFDSQMSFHFDFREDAEKFAELIGKSS